MSKKIFISRPLPQNVVAAARAVGDCTVRAETTPLSKAEMISALQDYDAILPTLGDRFSAELFAETAEPKCKMLANFGVGYNHIDATAAKAAGIIVTNTPGAVTDATADIAVSLILMSCRRLGEGERMVRAENWAGWHPTQMLGQHVSGKTIGIVGMGRIGTAIAQRMHLGFGCAIRYVARSKKDLAFAAERAESLEALAAASDVLVVAVPGSPQTHHLINKQVFAAMPPHAHFVNIARGDVVDETALVAALEKNQIAGAGLDVYEFEPKVPKALLTMENVTLLPHLGTASLEVREDMGMMAVANLRAYFAGDPPPNCVN